MKRSADNIQDPGDIAVEVDSLPQRPDALDGTTYRIRTPHSEHSYFLTVNHFQIDGQYRPFEIFINTKNMESFEWITALTRLASAVMRREDKPIFLVAEMKAIFDAKGGYFRPGGRRINSVVAEIGDCLEKHLIKIGMIDSPEEERRPA